MGFSSAYGFGKGILKKVRHTFSESNADTGQQMSTLTGSPQISGGVYTTASGNSMSAVSQGMGDSDYTVKTFFSGNTSAAAGGPAFWGTSATGGTWWSVTTSTSYSSIFSYRYCANTEVTTSGCTGTLRTCTSGPSQSTPSNCDAGCSGGCSTTNTLYSMTVFSSGNYCLSVGSCGSICQFYTPGQWLAKCGTCNDYQSSTTCTGAESYCYTEGCTPSGCGSCSISTVYDNQYYTNLNINSGAPNSQSAQASLNISTSSSGYGSIRGIIVTTSGSTIVASAYSDPSLTSQVGSSLSYSPSGPTKGDFVGVYVPSGAQTITEFQVNET